MAPWRRGKKMNPSCWPFLYQKVNSQQIYGIRNIINCLSVGFSQHNLYWEGERNLWFHNNPSLGNRGEASSVGVAAPDINFSLCLNPKENKKNVSISTRDDLLIYMFVILVTRVYVKGISFSYHMSHLLSDMMCSSQPQQAKFNAAAINYLKECRLSVAEICIKTNAQGERARMRQGICCCAAAAGCGLWNLLGRP